MHTEAGKGFTIIEIIITIVILGIAALFGFTFFSSLANTYATMRNERNIHQEGAYIIERIARELRNASAVTSTNPLRFTLQYKNQAGVVTTGTPADSSPTVEYNLSGTQLNRIGSSTIVVGTGIDANSFSAVPVTAGALGNACYRVSFTKDGGQRSYQTTVCPKNFGQTSSAYGGNYYDNY
jgi:prepilin-type N-terminal cleavage/methylation domain-containing protein